MLHQACGFLIALVSPDVEPESSVSDQVSEHEQESQSSQESHSNQRDFTTKLHDDAVDERTDFCRLIHQEAARKGQ